MNRRIVRIAAAALAAGFVLAPVAQAQEAPATPDNLAAQAARKGSQELRRFIERTRAVYGLHYEDYRKYLPE